MIKKISIKLSPKEFIEGYLLELTRCLNLLDKDKIEFIIDVLVTAYKKDRKVFILGNGGAASTSSHMACDLGKGTLQRMYDNTERRFRVISLTDNVALMTAFANDLSFDDIFVQQLRNLVETDDVVIALSGSGNSPNVVKAVEYAKSCGAKTIGILGFKTGGKLGNIVDYSIIVNSNHYGPIEDIQLILNHMIAAWIAKVKNIHDEKEDLTNENKAVPFK
ncbi:MAG: SIS domain-containing protein [Candidatus Parcubacteria bacterium]|nr:SIS domain-containing protein [Candidatus Parcubacteria bacterium]